ncbi:extracellular solute-binding protein [Thioclava sp. GXIMD4215]|uniref:extracellular solute-binding protein n=1 Tax=Thioclava sp. GXIMD4215 TaxID=3131928 RepID=UPI0038733A29
MQRTAFRRMLIGAMLAASPLLIGSKGFAAPQHALAMTGAPALPDGFDHLPYANPDAPKGGALKLGEVGTFDSLNPWILLGRPATGISQYVTESLMARSIDEPFTLYGLLAESVDTDAARSYVEYTLRPEAHFSDGKPVTVEDVIWSYKTLGEHGHPRYRNAWAKVKDIRQTGPRSVRITFNAPDRELALLMGMRPILEKAQWAGKDFEATTDMVPVGSGPYVVDQVSNGRFISFKRDPDWWGKDVNFNHGLWNFDTIRHEYFKDGNVIFEAFKAGDVDAWREMSDARWQNNYNFAAAQSGEIVKDEIPHARPSGIDGLVMNTRNPLFKDWRVREALTEVFNFEFINKTLNNGAEPRVTSFFSNSELGMQPGPASGKVKALLAPFAGQLAPGTLEGTPLPVSDGREMNRKNTRKALKLLEDAGWTVARDGVLRNASGQPFQFEILLRQGGGYGSGPYDPQSVVDIYVQALERIGVKARVTTIDDAQYVQRARNYQFDMTWYWRALSLSPGNEQMLYWGSAGVAQPGSWNYMGMASPAAEAMIRHMLAATDHDEYVAAVRALDRILTQGRYVIPAWYSKSTRLAHKSSLHYPETLPVYGDWPGFMPDTWWYEADK